MGIRDGISQRKSHENDYSLYKGGYRYYTYEPLGCWSLEKVEDKDYLIRDYDKENFSFKLPWEFLE